MATYTPNLGLMKPAPEEFFSVEHQNGNMDRIDAAYMSSDYGYFTEEEDEVAAHNAAARTHSNLVIDGNVQAGESVQVLQADEGDLDEHRTDPYAHQNLWIDGNAI